MGRANERVTRAGHDKLPVFGIGKDTDELTWKGVFRQLAAAGHLTGDDDGYGTLLLTDAARPVLRGEQRFLVRVATKETRAKSKRQSKSAIAVAEADRALFEALRALRLRLAAEAKLPPYIICTDVTLAELASARPVDTEALHGITGLGNSKIARYGAALLATIVAARTPSGARQRHVAGRQPDAGAAPSRASTPARSRQRGASTSTSSMGISPRPSSAASSKRATCWGSRKPTSTKSTRRSTGSARWKSGKIGPVHAALEAASTTASSSACWPS